MQGYLRLVRAAAEASHASIMSRNHREIERASQAANWAWADRNKFALKQHEFEELFYTLDSTRASTSQPEGVI